MTNFMAELLASIALKLFDKAKEGPKHVDGKKPGKIEKRLRDKLKKQLSVVLICCTLAFFGCTNKVVYVPHGKAVQLADD